jgi:polysaccharide biosynthesis transport protein
MNDRSLLFSERSEKRAPFLSHLPAPEPRTNLIDYWLTTRKHFRLISAVFICTILVTTFAVFAVTPRYTAHTELMIEPSTPQVLDMQQVFADSLTPDIADDYYKTQYDLLKSETIAAQVIRNLDLESDPRFKRTPSGLLRRFAKGVEDWVQQTIFDEQDTEKNELLGVKLKTVERYLDQLGVTPVRGTHLVNVSFTSPDSELSAAVANAHAAAYISQGLELHRSVNEEAQRFLEDKLVELKDRLQKSEAALNAYRRDKGIISLDDKENILVERLDDLNRDLTTAETERITLEAQEQLIHKRVYDSLPAVVDNRLIQELKEQLITQEGEYTRLSAKYQPGYRALDEVGAQLRETRARLQTETQEVVGGIESAYMAAVTNENTLRGELEQQKSLALQQKDAGVTYNILSREVDTNRQLYDGILQRMKETGVAAQVGASNVFVIVKASPPRYPSHPARITDILLGAMLALIGGVGLAFMLESFDKTFKNAEEVERYLERPNLAVIPDFTKVNGKGSNGHVPVRLGLPETLPERMPVIAEQIHFLNVVESYRALRTVLLLSRAGGPPKITLITSALNSEGKTVTAVNVAILLSEMSQRVLLIDADLRRADCHKLLGIQKRSGLAEVLTGQMPLEQVSVATAIPHLSLLCSGSLPPNPTELLGSEKMHETLTRLREQYDYIVIDSAPAMLVSDTLPLSTVVDGTVVVVNWRTPRHVVGEACSRLNYVGAKILGVVLNQVNLESPDFYYSSHYYSSRRSSYYERPYEKEAGA